MSTRSVGNGETLVWIGGGDPAAPMTWAHIGANGEIIARGVAAHAGDAPSAPSQRAVLVLPGADVRVKRLELQARTEAQARAGAPFLFEGEVAAQEGMHYATGAAQDESGHRLVAAISEARLTQWMQRVRALGADPAFVTADFTLWPTLPGEVEIIDTAERTIVAGGGLGGFAIEPDLAPSLLGRWFAHERVSAIIAHTERGDVWSASAIAPVRITGPVDVVAGLGGAAANPPDFTPNLRQGVFAPASAQTQKPWRLWRFAAFLALVAVVLQIGSMVVAGFRDQRAADQILAAAEREFRAARPDVQRVVNLRAQVAALVNAMQQTRRHPVIAVTDPLIAALQAQPIARLDELRHEGQTRSVRLRLSAPQPQALEAIGASLREQGLSVETQALQPVEGRYAVELLVESPP